MKKQSRSDRKPEDHLFWNLDPVPGATRITQVN
jgi:hypothetical protein